jgi:hypothetical protein
LAGLSRQEKKILQKPECVAGDAVLIAPVSGQFPCKQGIFQGKTRSCGSSERLRAEKWLCRFSFSRNALSKLTGKLFRRTGNFLAGTENVIDQIASTSQPRFFARKLTPLSSLCKQTSDRPPKCL